MSSYCNKCGNALVSSDDQFCEACGASVEQKLVRTQKPVGEQAVVQSPVHTGIQHSSYHSDRPVQQGTNWPMVLIAAAVICFFVFIIFFGIIAGIFGVLVFGQHHVIGTHEQFIALEEAEAIDLNLNVNKGSVKVIFSEENLDIVVKTIIYGRWRETYDGSFSEIEESFQESVLTVQVGSFNTNYNYGYEIQVPSTYPVELYSDISSGSLDIICRSYTNISGLDVYVSTGSLDMDFREGVTFSDSNINIDVSTGSVDATFIGFHSSVKAEWIFSVTTGSLEVEFRDPNPTTQSVNFDCTVSTGSMDINYDNFPNEVGVSVIGTVNTGSVDLDGFNGNYSPNYSTATSTFDFFYQVNTGSIEADWD